MNDLYIVGYVCSEGLVLVMNNVVEFECVFVFEFENWVYLGK